MYVCLMIVCMCADCMYAIVLDVCMYAEKRKKYTILNPFAWTGCFGIFFVYRPLDFLAVVWYNPVPRQQLSRKLWIRKISPNWLNNKLLYRVTYVCLLNDCLYVCWLYVCNCTGCMYVCWKNKEIYYPEFLCWDWLFWRLLCVQASWFPSAGVI